MSQAGLLTASTIVIAGFAALSGSASSATADRVFSSARAAAVASLLPKGDRLAVGGLVAKAPVRTVLTSGSAGDFRAVMRDGSGRVVYDSSASHRVTVVARNAEIPPIPVPADPVVASRDMPEAARPASPARSVVPTGCERLVSVLARSAASDLPGRCLT